MERTINKLTKLVLSFLMVITCVNISSIRAEDGVVAVGGTEEVDIEMSDESTQEDINQSHGVAGHQEDVEKTETSEESTTIIEETKQEETTPEEEVVDTMASDEDIDGEADVQNDESGISTASLDLYGTQEVDNQSGNTATFTATIQNAEVAYYAWHETSDTSSVSFTTITSGTVSISNFTTNSYRSGRQNVSGKPGYVVFFVKTDSEHLVTGLGTSGNGDVYPIDTTDWETLLAILDYPM